MNQKRKHFLSRGLRALEPVLLLALPVVLVLCTIYDKENTLLLSGIALAVGIVPFFIRLELTGLRARDICPIVIMAALAAVGRVLFAPLADVKPTSAIIIVAGACFGSESGFLTGALAALSSNLFFGQGPWTPWQMYAWGIMGYLAGAAQRVGWLTWNQPWRACVFGGAACLLYGFIMDSWTVVGYLLPGSLKGALLGYAAGFPFNLIHGISTICFLAVIWKPWGRKLRRIKEKYGMLPSF